jgi:hypothetical protein
MIESVKDEGAVRYYLNGVPHRSNGPAFVWGDGIYYWLLYNSWHRYYGPSNNLYYSWWIHGCKIK